MDKGVLDLHIQVKFHIITPQLYEYIYIKTDEYQVQLNKNILVPVIIIVYFLLMFY